MQNLGLVRKAPEVCLRTEIRIMSNNGRTDLLAKLYTGPP